MSNNIPSRALTARKRIGSHLLPIVYKAIEHVENRVNNTQVLDFGCGYGQAREFIEEKLCMEWYGFDIYPRCNTEKMLKESQLIVDWLEGYSGMAFDVVCLSNVLNIQETPDQLLDTIEKAFKQARVGGFVIWNYPNNPRKMPNLNVENIMDIINLTTNQRFETAKKAERQFVIMERIRL